MPRLPMMALGSFLQWVEKAWQNFDEQIIKKTVPKVHISPSYQLKAAMKTTQDITQKHVPKNNFLNVPQCTK